MSSCTCIPLVYVCSCLNFNIYKGYLHGGKTNMLYLNLSGHDICERNMIRSQLFQYFEITIWELRVQSSSHT